MMTPRPNLTAEIWLRTAGRACRQILGRAEFDVFCGAYYRAFGHQSPENTRDTILLRVHEALPDAQHP